MKKRGSGLLLHISSLPSRFGIGDLGPEAYDFVDFLALSKQRFWQILPLNPTDPDFDNSPYRALSAFAFNPLLISLEKWVEEGLLEKDDIVQAPAGDEWSVDYEAVAAYKIPLFDKAFNAFQARQDDANFRAFCKAQSYWLDDYALFKALREHFSGDIWYDWPKPLRDREPAALAEYQGMLEAAIEKEKFLQFAFMQQWQALRAYCRKREIEIIGDIPIYVAMDSSDVWTHSAIFKLDDDRKPLKVSGVPPDYFSETGQLWGNPVYNWEAMELNGFSWWLHRFQHNLSLFDIVRVDHFRGLVGYWEVPADEETAMNGQWVQAPAEAFLQAVKDRFGQLPIIAEDLGLITQDVIDIMAQFELPGMRVLQFAFSGDLADNDHIPFNVVKNSFLFTGTHDNNTTVGWLATDATEEERRQLKAYTGQIITEKNVADAFIRLALSSVANTVIVPVQDILALDGRHRMNRPFSNAGNWLWQLKGGQLGTVQQEKLSALMATYGR